MTEVITLAPEKSAVILIDMINAVVKGSGPPYSTPPQREPVVRNFQKLLDHCRTVGTPLVFVTTHRRPDNADALKTIPDVGGGGGVPMLAGTPATEFIDELRPQSDSSGLNIDTA